MIRWKSSALGAAVFVTAHVIQMVFWREWFEPRGDYAAWFLNSGRAVAFTAGSLFVAAVVVGIATRGVLRESVIAGGNLAAGAVVAMAVVLALTGPGSLFPIALAIGAGIAAFSCIAGAFAGSLLRKTYP